MSVQDAGQLGAARAAETAGPAAVARASLLRMGRAWQAAGQVNQAIGVYERILSRYPGTAEARAAATSLLALAQEYERQGQYRLAMGLYAKLESLVPEGLS